jgi:hypothetical protein
MTALYNSRRSDKRFVWSDIDNRCGRGENHGMTRFLVTYHGAGMPEGDEARQQAMAAFGQWVSKTGKALIDPGAPLGPSKTVSKGSITDGPASGPLGGYSIIEADDLDGAVELVRDHPFVGRGGSLQVNPAVAP